MEDQPFAQPFDAPKPRRRALLYGCVIIAVIVLAAVIPLSIRGWNAFVAFGIASDLTEYHKQIGESDLDDETTRRLLDQLDRVRAKIREKPIGFFRWLSYSDSIENLLRDGTLTADEVRTLQRELDRLEKEVEGSG